MKNENLSRILSAIIIILLILLYFKQCTIDKNVAYNNDKYFDSVIVLQNKIGKLYSQNDVLLSDLKDLKNKNKDLYDEVKNMPNKVIFITNTQTKIIYRDTTLKSKTVEYWDSLGNKIFSTYWYKDSTFSRGNYLNIAGNSNLTVDTNLKLISSVSSLDSLEIGTKIYLSLSEEKKQLKINARSDFPGLTFSDLDGALIDPKKSEVLKNFFPPKRWSIGVNAGWGMTLSGELKTGPYIGAGISYSFIRF